MRWPNETNHAAHVVRPNQDRFVQGDPFGQRRFRVRCIHFVDAVAHRFVDERVVVGGRQCLWCRWLRFGVAVALDLVDGGDGVGSVVVAVAHNDVFVLVILLCGDIVQLYIFGIGWMIVGGRRSICGNLGDGVDRWRVLHERIEALLAIAGRIWCGDCLRIMLWRR